MSSETNIIPYTHTITSEERVKKNGYKPALFWFTGLSGSGKSTLSNALETYFFNKGYGTYILDGDNVRSGLNADLDFSEEGRTENIRRIAEVSNLFLDAGTIVLTAFISPLIKNREQVRTIVGDRFFFEVHVDCPLEVCEKRDVKGLYKKARAGEIKNFTGIDAPFEEPIDPFLKIDSANCSMEECLDLLIKKTEPLVSYGEL